MDGMPKRINYLNLREATTPASEPEVEQPMRVIHANELVKVGGLYRIRDNYDAVWSMESNEDGKRYIVRADAEGDTAPERLRVESTDRAENQPKAAGAVEAGAVEAGAVEAGASNYDTREKECSKCKGKCECKAAYKVIHAGAVYVAWECDDCATSNLTKFGTRTYECDECHRRYADAEVLRVDEPKKQTFTRAEVKEHSPEFAKRMGTLGISVAHVSLLNVWEKEADKKDAAKKVNPWAVCHSTVGPEKSEKFERCVQDVKKQD